MLDSQSGYVNTKVIKGYIPNFKVFLKSLFFQIFIINIYHFSLKKSCRGALGKKYKKKGGDGSQCIRLVLGIAAVLNLVGPMAKWTCYFFPQSSPGTVHQRATLGLWSGHTQHCHLRKGVCSRDWRQHPCPLFS